MIISASYFKSIIKIPNVQDVSPTSNLLGNTTEIELFIEEYEADLLTKCFGYSLYKEFKDQFDINTTTGAWTIKAVADQKWKDLLNGKEYTINGVDVKFNGLIFKELKLDRSLIAYYIYCEFLNDDASHYSGVGLQKEKAKNSNPATINAKYTASWRKFHELTEFSNNCNGGYGNGVRSLYEFIYDMNSLITDTYNNWHPERFDNINSFEI